MKTKLLLFAALCLGYITLNSCSENNENIDNNKSTEDGVAVWYIGYVVDVYTTGYTSVEGSKICNNFYGKLPENSIFSIDLTCDENMVINLPAPHFGEYDQQFFEYAEKYGEYGTFEGYTSITSAVSIPYNITDIKIRAVNDYNENYKAGYELTDIARLTYASFEPFISNGYEVLPEMELTPLQEGGIPMFDPTLEFWAFPYYNVTLPKDGKDPIILPSLGTDFETMSYLACVSFLEAPTTTTPQFEVSVTFEDGTVISGSFEIEL